MCRAAPCAIDRSGDRRTLLRVSGAMRSEITRAFEAAKLRAELATNADADRLARRSGKYHGPAIGAHQDRGQSGLEGLAEVMPRKVDGLRP